jgi:hypothetical protein
VSVKSGVHCSDYFAAVATTLVMSRWQGRVGWQGHVGKVALVGKVTLAMSRWQGHIGMIALR